MDQHDLNKRFPLTINSTGRKRLVPLGRFSRTRNGGWYTVGECIAKGETFRIFSQRWFPVNTIVICDCAGDIDFFICNPEATIDANGFSYEWLDANEPHEAVTLNLFPEWWEDNLPK